MAYAKKDTTDWKPLQGYEGLYKISSCGKLYSYYVNRLKIPTSDKDGYLVTSIVKGGVEKKARMHRLVAQNFLNNSKNKPEVNHKNGNKSDNVVTNLEWATSSENNFHKRRVLKSKGYTRKVIMGDEEGNMLKSYDSIKSAAKDKGVSSTAILNCCKGVTNHSAGFCWEYA